MEIEEDRPLRPSRPEFAEMPRRRPVEKILVATDFSPASDRAVERAFALAEQCDAALTALHVVDTNAQPGGSESGVAADMMDRLWNGASAGMNRLARLIGGRVNAQVEVVEGLPWERIVEESRNYNLLILSNNGKNSRPKLFSRRTTQRVLENAACPVMLV